MASVRNCDQIYLLHEGEVAERGTHVSLLREDGRYAVLYALQGRMHDAVVAPWGPQWTPADGVPPKLEPCDDTAMRVLVVGGAGYVAGLVMPALAEHHTIRVLDRRPPPASPEVEHVLGSATDFAALRAAAQGMDAVLHCAMGTHDWAPPDGAADGFDVNVKSVHLTLRAAHEAGVPHAVHISSLSIYRDITERSLDESTPPDATDLYGLTKRLGEQVCLAATQEWGLSVTVLRLAWPTPDDVWPAWGVGEQPRLQHAPDGTLIEATAATDLSAALLAALTHRAGFDVFTITGDRSARLWSTAKAARELGWTPTFRK